MLANPGTTTAIGVYKPVILEGSKVPTGIFAAALPLQYQLIGAGMDVKVGIDVPSQPQAGLLKGVEPKRVRSTLG
jgi:hypothetical protein